MIRLFIISFIINNTFSAEILLGGVDVGNGKVISLDFEVNKLFNSEEELVNYVEINKKSISNGTYLDIRKRIKEFDCSNKLSFKHLEIEETYPYINGELIKKKYNGNIRIELTNCKKDKNK